MFPSTLDGSRGRMARSVAMPRDMTSSYERYYDKAKARHVREVAARRREAALDRANSARVARSRERAAAGNVGKLYYAVDDVFKMLPGR